LRCPYHGWNYDETGALVGVPDSQHYPALGRANMALQPVHVCEWRGLVFVAFDKPELELADGIDASAVGQGTSFAALRRLSEPRTQQVRADWKLACEHLLDVSHLAIARPALKPKLFDPAPYASCGAFAVRAVSGMEHTAAAPCWPARAYAKFLPAVTPRVMEAIFVWPNLLLQFMPDQLGVVHVLPAATGTCSIREVSYGVPDASGELRVARYASARVRRRARAQDTRILERLKEGLAGSPVDRAGLLAAQENGLHWFVERLRAAGHGGAAKSIRRRRIRHPTPLPA
jgi:phenylpropionate dioxygenase-like ring-hydroxylating dioxygenase large terminal subunit